jgi:hypothetical protein
MSVQRGDMPDSQTVGGKQKRYSTLNNEKSKE